MYRTKDESGVSGTGKVLEGIIFESGSCVVSWLTSLSSLGVYNSYQHFLRIHVFSHATNGSIIVFDDDGHQERY